MAKPKPVPKNVVCSECGLPWAAHTAGRKTDPTPDVCIRLLSAELSKVRASLAQRQTFVTGTSGTINPFFGNWGGQTFTNG